VQNPVQNENDGLRSLTLPAAKSHWFRRRSASAAAIRLPRSTPEGRIHLLSDDGETTVIEAGPVFKILSRNSLNERVQASLAVSQGRLFIRTAGTLCCIGRK
jgi:hypothetical protein